MTSGGSNIFIGAANNSSSGITSGNGNIVLGFNYSHVTGNLSNTFAVATSATLLLADGTSFRPQVPLKLLSSTVASLPSASTVGAGTEMWATDLSVAWNAANLFTTAAGSGSNGGRVVSNGANWVLA